MPKLRDLEMAVDFVSAAPFSEHVALLSRSTGEIYYHAESSDFDELPDDADESEEYLELPHKNDLHPGHVLVRRFVRERLPEREDTVRGFFARRGAYSRYKSLLHELDLLEVVVRVRECPDQGGSSRVVRGQRREDRGAPNVE